MGSNKPVLLVCRSLNEMHLLNRFQPENNCCYIVASNDLRVHLEIAKYPWVADVCYLEQMESYYSVAAEVIRLLELINQWLESLGNDFKGIPKELLFWIRNAEGGITTQRIQDLLLLIRSYKYILDTYKVKTILILRNPQAEWEDDVLMGVAQFHNIEVRIIGQWRFSILKAKLLSWLKFAAREPYYIALILFAKLRGAWQSQRSRPAAQEIVVQLCIPSDKFVQDHLPLMKALAARGYQPVALLWRASPAAAPIQQAGLGVAELETLVPLSGIFAAPYRVWLTWRQARRRRAEFFSHPELRYAEISLGPLLWPAVLAFFGEELASRYRLKLAARNYFAHHAPKAIKLWGRGVLAEGAVVASVLKGNQNPVTFFWGWAFYENPYWIESPFCELILASGDIQVDYFHKLGVPAAQIAKVGIGRYDHLEEFQHTHSPAQSQALLNIPQQYQYYILFDSNATLRGYHTIQEQSLVTETLLNFIREYPEVALLIKPHPIHSEGWLEALIDLFKLPNVFLIDKNMEPYHAINAADLLITKFSTIAMEAMLFKKAVIAISLDGEERFRIYGDAVEPVNSLAGLHTLLTQVVNDADARRRWRDNQLQNQAIFLEQYLGKDMGNAAQKGAAAVDRFIRQKSTFFGEH